MNFTKLSVFVAGSLFVAGAAGQEVLLNGGFEAGTGGDADNWGELAGPAGVTERNSGMPNTGSWAAYMSVDHVNNAPAAAAYFIEQNLGANTIDASAPYNLTFSAKVDSTDQTGINAFVQIQWLDQDGSDGGGVKGEMLTSLFDLGITTDYQQFSFLGLDVPDGADSFLLRFQLAAGPVDQIQNGLWVDDASLFRVPAPAGAALLGLGGLAAARRRR